MAKLQLGALGGKRPDRQGRFISQIIGDGLTQRILNFNSQDTAQAEEEHTIGGFQKLILGVLKRNLTDDTFACRSR